MTDIGHAGADEHFIDGVAHHGGKRPDIVRIVWAGHQRLLDFVQVDFQHMGIFGVGVRLQQFRRTQPGAHGFDAAAQRAAILVAAGDHVLHQRDIGIEKLDHRFRIEPHRAAVGGTLGGGVGKLERLLHLEVRQAFDLQDAAIEHVLLARLANGEIAVLDRGIGNGVDQVAQSDAGLHGAGETHQNRLRHVQGHGAHGGGESHQAGTGRERDADGEPGVRVAASAHGVGQDHAVEPGMDHAVARTQAHPAAAGHKFRQAVLQPDIHRLGIGRSVAETLHHQVGGKSQAGQFLQFVARHGAGGVLRTDGGDFRLAVGAGADSGHAASAPHHLLRQGVSLAGILGGHLLDEQAGRRQAERFAGPGGEPPTDDQRDAAAGAHFIRHGQRRQVEGADDFAGRAGDPACVRVDHDHISRTELFDIALDRQRAGIFRRVEENRRNLAAQHDAAGALVGDMRNILAHQPLHRVDGGLARGAGADHVAHIGQRQTLLLERSDGIEAVRHLGYQHGPGMQWNIRARPGLLCGREIVGIGFARHLEHHAPEFTGQLGAHGEPFGVGPGFDQGSGMHIAIEHFFLHIMKRIEHQGGMRQRLDYFPRQRAVEQGYQRLHVIAAQHGAQQGNRPHRRHQPGTGRAAGNVGQECRLDVGGLVNPCRGAVFQQIDQHRLLAGRRIFQQLHQFGRLLGIKRQRRQAKRSALGNMCSVSVEHGRSCGKRKLDYNRDGAGRGVWHLRLPSPPGQITAAPAAPDRACKR
ncbi:hypothetical protein GALL_392070 [mine drainage metagenome]|uniref:Uncharacterized protein n=1 Tax=mine drainage metagenome TaxID=410659 RepID=A0A1J5Q5T1_9ZZZZ